MSYTHISSAPVSPPSCVNTAGLTSLAAFPRSEKAGMGSAKALLTSCASFSVEPMGFGISELRIGFDILPAVVLVVGGGEVEVRRSFRSLKKPSRSYADRTKGCKSTHAHDAQDMQMQV
jgi:hypothetical protein